MSIHLMMDLETWSTRPNAAISQIALVPFVWGKRGRVYNDKIFNRYVVLQDNVGVVDHGTLMFWMKEGSPGRMKLIEGLENEGMTCGQALQEMLTWPKSTGIPGFESWGDIDGLWSRGAAFDIPILKSAFNMHGLPEPWSHKVEFCARTLDITHGPVSDIDTTGMIQHFAPDDCLFQIMALQRQLFE